jgi:hypothetical protein
MGWKLSDDLLPAKINEDYMMIDLDQGRYLSVNATGTVIIEAIVAGGGIDDAVAAVVKRFEIEDAEAREDVLAFVSWMREKGYLKDGAA